MAKFELKGKYTDGTDWTAGTFDVPTSLPNYVSFEKPTSVSVSADGSEVTYTGVAEFESAGSMESGEFHEVMESTLVFIKPGLITSTISPGLQITFASTDFNRTPHVNEYCSFITQDSSGIKYAWGGKCSIISSTIVIFQVYYTIIIDTPNTEKKKHLKHVVVTQTLCQLTFSYLSTTENAPASVSSLTSQLTEFYSLGSTAKALPATGNFLFSNKTYGINRIEVTASGGLKMTGVNAANTQTLEINSIEITSGAINFYLIY